MRAHGFNSKCLLTAVMERFVQGSGQKGLQCVKSKQKVEVETVRAENSVSVERTEGEVR